MEPKNSPCKAADSASGLRQSTRSVKMSARAGIRVQGLGDDAHIGDAGLFDRVHYGGKSAKGNVFIGAQEDGLALGIAHLLAQDVGDLVDVDGLVAQVNALRAVNGDHQALLGDLLDG